MNKFNKICHLKDCWQAEMAIKYPIKKVGGNKYVSVQIMAAMADYDAYSGHNTYYCYKAYEHFCQVRNVTPISHIAFSKFVVRNFNYWIQNKKMHGKKYRVFRQW